MPCILSFIQFHIFQDARVSVKACEGLMLVASLPDENAVKHLLYNTEFTNKLTSQLCSLYTFLPKGIYPADVESVDAKWGSVLTAASNIAACNACLVTLFHCKTNVCYFQLLTTLEVVLHYNRRTS